MRLKTFLVGVGLVYVVTYALILFLGSDSWLFIPILVASYGGGGVIVGFLWPEAGWRLGLWLVAFWFIMMLLSLPFSDPSTAPWEAKQVMRDLLANVMIVVAACFGVELGAIIKQRWTPNPSL